MEYNDLDFLCDQCGDDIDCCICEENLGYFGAFEEDEDDFGLKPFGCPDGCVMTGAHFSSDCHTSEYLEEYYEQERLYAKEYARSQGFLYYLCHLLNNLWRWHMNTNVLPYHPGFYSDYFVRGESIK